MRSILSRVCRSTLSIHRRLEFTTTATVTEQGDFYLRLYTGDVRGGGSGAGVFFSLADGDRVYLDTEDNPLERGTVREFVIPSGGSSHLEHLLQQTSPTISLRIGHDESGLGSGWYLDKAEVVDSATGRMLAAFPCDRWLGTSDNGGFSGPPIVDLMNADADADGAAGNVTRSTESELCLAAAGTCVPHMEKVLDGAKGAVSRWKGHAGEDAFFIAESAPVVGIADGVYAWREEGIDAGVFSRSLLAAAADGVQQHGETAPEKLLDIAWDHVQAHEVKGSSTVCVAALGVDARGVNVLRTANIGDSGYILCRPTADGDSFFPVSRSPQQEHGFGCPYQLGHHDSSATPRDAQIGTVETFSGDVLVLGSDGLFDNVTDCEICDTVHSVAGKGVGATAAKTRKTSRDLAHSLAKVAFEHSIDKKCDSPYSLAATEEFDLIFRGGKQDDITVVVCTILSSTTAGI